MPAIGGWLAAKLLAPFLDWALANLFKLTGWAVKKIQKRARISKANSNVDKEVDALLKTILEAKKDGEITQDEINDIINAARMPNSKY